MKIQILGVGTAFFMDLKNSLVRLTKQLGIDDSIEEVRNLDSIIQMNATTIPAIAINGKVILGYTFPHEYNENELIKILQRELGGPQKMESSD